MNSIKELMATTILVGSLTVYGFMIYSAASAEGLPTITSETRATANRPLTEAVVSDTQFTAQRFIEHVNYARVSLAMKNTTLAKDHIARASDLLAVLKSASSESYQVKRVESGRLIYSNEPTLRNYYFPIKTGPVDMKKVDTGPFWAENMGAAVTDAEIVYLTLNVNSEKGEKGLARAIEKIDAGEYAAAQSALGDLINSMVREDKSVTLPNEKARDNLALSRSFLARKNYDGARYALGHAREALDEMERDDRYAGRKQNISAMRSEVTQMQADIRKNDPSLLQRADVQIQRWWNELKN